MPPDPQTSAHPEAAPSAPAAVAGLAQLGVAGITVVARNPDKAAPAALAKCAGCQ
ncbi:hypothetical protein MAHJHV55_52050 [Mycobacterium avium subsp. hominissuis]